jgi:hypothetical protein
MRVNDGPVAIERQLRRIRAGESFQLRIGDERLNLRWLEQFGGMQEENRLIRVQ